MTNLVNKNEEEDQQKVSIREHKEKLALRYWIDSTRELRSE